MFLLLPTPMRVFEAIMDTLGKLMGFVEYMVEEYFTILPMALVYTALIGGFFFAMMCAFVMSVLTTHYIWMKFSHPDKEMPPFFERVFGDWFGS